jgi:hypothetical protein
MPKMIPDVSPEMDEEEPDVLHHHVHMGHVRHTHHHHAAGPMHHLTKLGREHEVEHKAEEHGGHTPPETREYPQDSVPVKSRRLG